MRGARQIEGRVDQRDVGEGLREVADLPAISRIVFLREQPEIVAQRQQAVEQTLGLLAASDGDVGVREPEAAGQEDAFTGFEPVIGDFRVVAAYEAVDEQVPFDRLDSPDISWIARRDEADLGEQQQAGVERLLAKGRPEGVAHRIEATVAHLGMDTCPQLPPLVDRAAQSMTFHRLDGAIEDDPCHDLGEGKVLARPAGLPDAVIRFRPASRHMVGQRQLQIPPGLARAEAALARLLERVHQLAIDVELELLVRGIADPHRLRSEIAGQPVDVPFRQPPLAENAIHDLHVRGTAGNGTLQPVAPGRRFFVEAGIHQGEQGERRVADPAEAVVPVA